MVEVSVTFRGVLLHLIIWVIPVCLLPEMRFFGRPAGGALLARSDIARSNGSSAEAVQDFWAFSLDNIKEHSTSPTRAVLSDSSLKVTWYMTGLAACWPSSPMIRRESPKTVCHLKGERNATGKAAGSKLISAPRARTSPSACASTQTS